MIVWIVSLVFEIYILGLFVYTLTHWIRDPRTTALRHALAPFFEPVLERIRRFAGPVRVGSALIDLAIPIYFIILILARGLLLRIL